MNLKPKYKNINNVKIKKSYSLTVLNLFASYVLSNNINVSRFGLTNIRKLMDIIDTEVYMNDPEKIKRINFIKKALEARVDYNLNNIELIKAHIFNTLFVPDNDVELGIREISNEEIKWIDEQVSIMLQYHFIYASADEMISLGTKIKNENMDINLVKSFSTFVNNADSHLKNITPSSMDDNNTFTLVGDRFKDVVTRTHTILTSSNNKLKTGMTGLNLLLNGGFENSRVYLVLGVAGGGKSITLLNIANQIKFANGNFIAKDPTKIPTVLYITMENNIVESVQRLYDISTGKGDMTNYSLSEVFTNFEEAGMSVSEEGSNIDIVMKYIPSKSINATYIDKMIVDLERDGREVICVIQDHIKKMNAINPTGDLRVDLGDIINEFKTIAADRHIPFITNSHFNREGDRKLEEAIAMNKTEKVRLLKRSNIGESQLMLDNTDVCLAIALETSELGEPYIGLKSLKSRNGIGLDTDTIFQPFTHRDTIQLLEDTKMSMPKFKTSLYNSNIEQFNTGVENIKISPYSVNNIAELSKSITTTEEDNNIYEFK